MRKRSPHTDETALDLDYHETVYCDCGHHEYLTDILHLSDYNQTTTYTFCQTCWHLVPHLPASDKPGNCKHKLPMEVSLQNPTPLFNYLGQLIRAHKDKTIQLFREGNTHLAAENFLALTRQDQLKMLEELLFKAEMPNHTLNQFFFSLINK